MYIQGNPEYRSNARQKQNKVNLEYKQQAVGSQPELKQNSVGTQIEIIQSKLQSKDKCLPYLGTGARIAYVPIQFRVRSVLVPALFRLKAALRRTECRVFAGSTPATYRAPTANCAQRFPFRYSSTQTFSAHSSVCVRSLHFRLGWRSWQSLSVAQIKVQWPSSWASGGT